MTTPSDQISPTPQGVTPIGEFLRKLFALLETHRVEYCILRNYEGLPDETGNDLDVLVNEKHLRSFEQCLRQAATEPRWLLMKKPSRFHFRSYWFQAGSGAVLHIDVWDLHHWKGICFAPNNAFLKNRVRFRQFYIPPLEAEIGSLLIKDLIQNRAVRRTYAARIQEFAQTSYPQLRSFVEWPLGKLAAAWITAKAAEEKWDAIDSHCGAVRRALLRRSIMRNPLKTFAGFVKFLGGHLYACLTKPCGMFLVLTGPDGAGKSSVSEKLRETSSDMFGACRYYHGHFGLMPELKHLRNMLLRFLGVKPPASQAEEQTNHDVPVYGMIRALIYVCYYSLDYLLGHWVIRRHQSQGDLVIFDRYFYDYFIQAHFSRVPRWLLPVLKALLPRPNLVVYLRNSPQTIHERKPELTIEQIARQAQECSRLVANIPYAITVSTDVPVEDVIDRIRRKMDEIMAKRYRWNDR
ncbi:MAG: hypothetical protein J7M14_02475 [Planctomycetes bacterium]|nr:hypothetical protein [Planctomycetota bacterium]